MTLQHLCTPAFIYFLYAFTQIIIDVSSGLFNTALLKFTISIVLTIALNHLCIKGFKILAWIIVFIPFIFLTIVTSILLLGLGLNPYNGRLTVSEPDNVNFKSNDIRDIYTLKYGLTTKNNNLSPSTFNEGVTSVIDQIQKKDPEVHSIDTSKNIVSEVTQTNAQELTTNKAEKIDNCPYGEYPNCINKQIIPKHDEIHEDNKQENNTRILSNVLLNMMKTYVAEIPVEETTESIVDVIHGE